VEVPCTAEQVLENHFDVSKITVRRALDDLSREGLLVRRRGTASIVAHVRRDLPHKEVEAPQPVSAQRFSIPTDIPKSGRITGIIAGEMFGEYSSTLISELSKASLSRGIQVRCYPTLTPESAADVLNSLLSSGELHSFVLFSHTEVMRFLNHVLIGRGCRTVSVEALDLDAPYPYVLTDSRAAVTIGLEHLISLGHRRIVLLVNENPEHPTVRVKIERFRELVAQQGLESTARVFPAVWGKDDGYGRLDSTMPALWNERAEKPTAIFTVSDSGAWAAINWLYRHGVDVPGDVSVLGFENLTTSQFTRPTLTTVAHPFEQIAVRTIEALWSDDYNPQLHELVEPFLVLRESTGPVKR